MAVTRKRATYGAEPEIVCVCGHGPNCHRLGMERRCEHCSCSVYHQVKPAKETR